MSATTATSSKQHQAADQALTDILELFENPDRLPAAIATSLILRQTSDAPMCFWSLCNQLLVLLAGTVDARGFRQWQEVGRNVNKGAKALRILAPRTRKIRETDNETGQELERVVTIGFVGIPVFRYEDTNGAPLEQPDYRPATFPPLLDVAEHLGISVNWAPGAVQTQHGSRITSDRYGFYQPASDSVTLLSHDQRVWFHELAHAAHKRVLESRGRTLKGGQVPAQEAVAEIVSAVLCRLYDFESYLASCHDYVRHYSEHNDAARAAVRVLADVQAVLELLLQPHVSALSEAV
jgi:antirestriction protein ArdC